MIKISETVQDLHRVSGEIAAGLIAHPRQPGDIHIFADGRHAKLTVLGEDDDFRIVAKRREYRDGVEIQGNINDAINSALRDRQTSTLVFRRTEFYGTDASSPKAQDYLRSRGTLEDLNGKTILVVDDRYYNIQII